ncbi:MAG: hypothetical protein M3Y50_04545 [Acidobacteriota bacterium]|nr:hypothetical protein [Acidobacteriota bacterium]
MKRIGMCVLGTGLVLIAGCRTVEKSEIVKIFQAAGGGNANQATSDGIVQFLAKHDETRQQLTPLCKEKESKAPADWSTTDEGRICAGNDRANFFGKTKIESDGTKF